MERQVKVDFGIPRWLCRSFHPKLNWLFQLDNMTIILNEIWPINLVYLFITLFIDINNQQNNIKKNKYYFGVQAKFIHRVND